MKNKHAVKVLALTALIITQIINHVCAENRALIIGINKYKFINQLNGAVSDARNIQQLIRDVGNYKPTQIRLLTDLQATRQGILDGFRWLVEGTQPGDRVFFYFSGHGAQIKDTITDADEDDGIDETLCPVDTTAARRDMVIDDEINKFLQQLTGRQVLIVVDACHSGTIEKSIALPPGTQLKTPIFDIPLPEEKSIRVVKKQQLVNPTTQLIVYTAVASDQVAIDTANGGIFTSSFIKAIKDKRGEISHKNLLTLVENESARECEERRGICKFGLTPQLEIDASLENLNVFQTNIKPSLPIFLPPTVQFAKTFPIGAPMSFNIHNNNHQKEGYIVIWDVDNQGNVNVIFPNEHTKYQGYIQAGQSVTIPDSKDCLFTASEPVGKNAAIVAIVHDQITAKQVQAMRFSEDKTRGIQVISSKNRAKEVVEQVQQTLSKTLSEQGSFISLEYEITR